MQLMRLELDQKDISALRESKHLGHRVERSVTFKALSQSGGNVLYVGDELQERTVRRTVVAGFQGSYW